MHMPSISEIRIEMCRRCSAPTVRLTFNDAALVLGTQLLRSAPSVAASHHEANDSRSRAERIARFQLVLQELEESALWLEGIAAALAANLTKVVSAAMGARPGHARDTGRDIAIWWWDGGRGILGVSE